ncbi:hypothetical protein CPLU01_15867 [Colletotrichum plurivorum]|uniref:Uncharacterized protein n=1 Tax=Colletotrichum plurivorum TaxID=2175906 RepID=A0A8H6MRY7_9PEZI|nr:hypothetical protein CPLU01_15867 [Colletotrichum plurivorum]
MSPAATAASAVSSQPGGMGAGNSRPELSEMGDRGEDREGGSDEDISQYGDVSDAEQDVARTQRPKPASNQAEDDSGYHDGLSDVLGSDQDGNTEDGAEKAAEQGANDSAEDVVGTGAEESTDKARRRRRHPFVPPIIQECKDRGQYNGTLDSPSEATLIIMSVFNQDVIDPVIRAAMDQDSYAKAALHQKKSATDKMHALRAEGEALEKARWEAMMNKQTGPLDDAIAWTREAQEEMAQAARLPEVHMKMIGENRKRMLAQRGEEANEAKRLKLEKAAENARNALRVLANVAQEEMPSLGLGQD